MNRYLGRLMILTALSTLSTIFFSVFGFIEYVSGDPPQSSLGVILLTFAFVSLTQLMISMDILYKSEDPLKSVHRLVPTIGTELKLVARGNDGQGRKVLFGFNEKSEPVMYSMPDKMSPELDKLITGLPLNIWLPKLKLVGNALIVPDVQPPVTITYLGLATLPESESSKG